MKKLRLVHPSLVMVLVILVFFISCKKVNEATELGDGLVPEVDNINTFETIFSTETDNVLLPDTAKLVYNDPVALGTIGFDPEFGQTSASVFFQINPTSYGTYPFTSKENLQIDSVVLSLAYLGGYGDSNSLQTVRVYEVAQSAAFTDTSYYPFNLADIETTGPELGSATFSMSALNDSFPIIRKDTAYVTNQLHVRLSNSLGERFASYDLTTGTNGGYYNDTLFKNLFRGLAIKADGGTGNGLAFFDLTNSSATGLTIYYKAIKNANLDTAAVLFTHALRFVSGDTTSKGGQANLISRQIGGSWASYATNGTPQDDKIYIQSSPGSAMHIKIPALDTLQNKVIHRAELIATRLTTPAENFFIPPTQLFLDKVDMTSGNAYILHEFLSTSQTTGLPIFDFTSFGGSLRSDNTYRFNLTKTVQDIIARDSSNFQLRIYAPFDTRPFSAKTNPPIPVFVQAIPFPAYGRVVLAGGNYADPAMQLRLRVIYSNL